MAYSGCRKFCSTSVTVMKALQEAFDRRGRSAEFVVVTFDPDRDTPQAWRDYRRARDLARPNWHFLSGSAQDTRRMARFLDLDFWVYDDHIVHDFRIVIFDAEGRMRREIVWDRPVDPAALVDELPL